MRRLPRYASRNTVAPFYDSLAWRERYNPLPDLTPERTVELYCAWREGRYADVMFVFDALEEWDDTLGTLVDRRLSALGELDHGISINSDAVGDDPALQALADDQQQTMSDIMSRVSNMSEVIEHLGLATFRGFSHLEEVIDGDEIRLEPVDQWFWNRPMKRGPWFYNPTAVNSLSDLHPVSDGELIIRAVPRPVDIVALFAITIKAHSEAGWDGFIDVFGNPALFFEYPPGTSDEKAAEYDEIMFKLLGDGRGGYPAGGKIVPVETTATGGVTFQDRAVFANKKMIMRATGGTLTSLAESGTGTLAGEAQMEVFRTLAKAEAVKISEVISKQFVNRWLERLYPGKPRLVYWSMDAEDEKAKSANVDKITKMAAVGYRAEDEEVSEMTGMRVTYREPVLQSMGTPGLPLPLIRNREYTAPAVTTEERLLTVLDPEAIKRRAEIYTRLLEESAVSGLAAAAAETAAQIPAEGAQPPKTDNEPQDTGNPVATPLQNAGNGHSTPEGGEPVKNMSRSEAARHAANVRWGKEQAKGTSRESKEKKKQSTPLVAPKGSNEKTQVKALKEALDRVAKKGGSVTGAIHKEGVGALTVKGGTVGKKREGFKGGSGVAHVLRKHGSQGMTTGKMAVTAVKGKVMPDPQPSRSRIVHQDTQVIVEHENKKGSGRRNAKGGKLHTAHKKRTP